MAKIIPPISLDSRCATRSSSDLHTSSGPFMYAVEVRAGWFEEYGIRVGTQVQF